MHPHVVICHKFPLPSFVFIFFSFLLSVDACHMHRDQVEPSYAKEETKHHMAVTELMTAPLGNTEEP